MKISQGESRTTALTLGCGVQRCLAPIDGEADQPFGGGGEPDGAVAFSSEQSNRVQQVMAGYFAMPLCAFIIKLKTL
jgi:hypothetical protein